MVISSQTENDVGGKYLRAHQELAYLEGRRGSLCASTAHNKPEPRDIPEKKVLSVKEI